MGIISKPIWSMELMETHISQIPKSHRSYCKLPPCYNLHVEYRHFGSCHGEPTIRHRWKNTSCFDSGRQLFDWRNSGHIVQGMKPVKPPQVEGLSGEVSMDSKMGTSEFCMFDKYLTKKIIKLCIAGLHLLMFLGEEKIKNLEIYFFVYFVVDLYLEPETTLYKCCFTWMLSNLYKGNGCFTEHPFQSGCLGLQAREGSKWNMLDKFQQVFP